MRPRAGPTRAEGLPLESYNMGMDTNPRSVMPEYGSVFFAMLVLAASCGLCLGDVVINEVELSPPDNGTVWVELYNTGDEAVDISGWTVRIVDEPWSGSIGVEGAIGPKGFLVADGQPRWVTSGNGTVLLLMADGTVADRTPVLSDTEQTDFTYGRLPDGRRTETRADFAFMMASRGRPNGL